MSLVCTFAWVYKLKVLGDVYDSLCLAHHLLLLYHVTIHVIMNYI